MLLLAWGGLWLADEAGFVLPGSALGRAGAVLGLGSSVGQAADLAGAAIGGPFHLIDQNGRAVSDATYRGRWMLLYFGYTFCPDVCPTELQTIAAALGKLGDDNAKVVPIFVTVDPARDTPAVLAKYVHLFDKRLIGLTGTPAEIEQAARAYRVYYAKDGGRSGAAYAVDHSSFVYLMDPRGRLAALFNQDTSADDMAARIRARISRGT